MTEEVAESLGMMVTIFLMAAMVMVGSNVLFTMYNLFQSNVSRYEESIMNEGVHDLLSLNYAKDVSAPTAYKVIKDNIDIIENIQIKYIDGTETSDYKTLLKHDAYDVTVIVKRKGDYIWLYIKEVDRYVR